MCERSEWLLMKTERPTNPEIQVEVTEFRSQYIQYRNKILRCRNQSPTLSILQIRQWIQGQKVSTLRRKRHRINSQLSETSQKIQETWLHSSHE